MEKVIIGQALGIAATLITFASYQFNTKRVLLIIQTAATLCTCLSFLFLGASTGFALNIVCLVRNVVFYFENGKWRIPETGTLYAWSKEMYISPEGLDNTSVPGNQFYIVRRRGEAEIAYAYNKKFFEYKGKYNLS